MPGAGGLTPTRKFFAVIIGIVITLSYVFVTAPHPVSMPQQIVTPVPTPAPVSSDVRAVKTIASENSNGSPWTGSAILALLVIGLFASCLALSGRVSASTFIGFVVILTGAIAIWFIAGAVIDATLQFYTTTLP